MSDINTEIIGRKKEKEELLRLYNSARPEFVAVYGRRRVGKTFLIRETFHNSFSFHHTGLSPVSTDNSTSFTLDLKEQLKHFHHSLSAYGCAVKTLPSSWMDAFYRLEKLLESKYDGSRQVVFIDELPWMDTPKSNVVRALEAFWNGWCYGRNILLIVCGSAASWMLNKVINHHGGLYGRLTSQIRLAPFSLGETDEYYQQMGVSMSSYDLAEAYMVLGGIPYYMNMWRPDFSVAQNIDNLFFSKSANLKGEFVQLFSSLFAKPENYIRIVRLLSERNAGYTRAEIAACLNLESGGSLTSLLAALEASDFIQSYYPYNEGRRNLHYRLMDSLCLFYLNFVERNVGNDTSYWQHNILSHQVSTWRGLAFEHLVFSHIEQVKHALAIGGVLTNHSSWISYDDNHRATAQCDLVIERGDNVVNLCEMKFVGDEYAMTREENMRMRRRVTELLSTMKRRQSLHVTLITSFGLRRNEYSGIFTNFITLEDILQS